MLNRIVVLAVAVVGGATIATAGGKPAAIATRTAAAATAAEDSVFMEKAAGDGMAEVELAQLAADRAANPDVKAFAKMLADDHTKANGELTRLAAQKGVALPADPPPAAKAVKDRLGALSGPAFDQAYTAQMVTDHEKALTLFSHEVSAGRDADTRAWANKILITLRQHLSRARELSGGKSSSGSHHD